MNPARALMLQRELDAWDPDGTVACANCLHAKVFEQEGEPHARCAQGHGRTVALYAMIRRKQPRGIASATKCLDFTSMDDDT